MLLIENFTIC